MKTVLEIQFVESQIVLILSIQPMQTVVRAKVFFLECFHVLFKFMYSFKIYQTLQLFLKGKEVNEDEIVPTDDMLFTKGQLNAARDGILLFTKWGNEKGESLANTVVPYSFDSGISKKERRIVTNAVKKFNIDLKGCIHIV